MQAERANSRYLAGIAFPDALQVVSGDVMVQVQEADLIVLGTPMAALRQWLIRLQACRSPWSGCARASRPWPPMLRQAAMA